MNVLSIIYGLQEEYGWDEDSIILILCDFIEETGNAKAFQDYAIKRGEEENDEADDE